MDKKDIRILVEFLGMPDKGSIEKEWYYPKNTRCAKKIPKKMRSTNTTDRTAFLMKEITKLEDINPGSNIYLETNDIFHDFEQVWRKSRVLENPLLEKDKDAED